MVYGGNEGMYYHYVFYLLYPRLVELVPSLTRRNSYGPPEQCSQKNLLADLSFALSLILGVFFET